MKRIRFALLSAAVLLVSFGSGVVADDWYETITVSKKPVHIFVDNSVVRTSDKSGYYKNGEQYVPASLQYAGTTYVPLRLVFEAVGYEVEWKDGVIEATREKGETAHPLTFTFYDTPLLKWYFTERGMNYKYIYDQHEEILEDQIDWFGTTLKEPIQVYIFGDDTLFGGFRTQKYVAKQGLIKESSIAIHADSLQTGGINQDVRYHFSHELAHAMTDARWGILKLGAVMNGRDQWLGEGIAEYVSKHKVNFSPLRVPIGHSLKETGYGKGVYISTLKQLAQQRNIRWEDIRQFADTMNYGEYFVFESIVYYLETEYGHDKFIGFMDKLVESNLGEAFRSVYGQSEEELVRSWKTYFDLQ